MTSRRGEKKSRCNDELQHLGFPNPSQLVAARTILVAASALCLDQPNHKSQSKFYYSQTKPIIALGSNLTAVSTHVFHQLSTKP